jgi:hypothetical protein
VRCIAPSQAGIHLCLRSGGSGIGLQILLGGIEASCSASASRTWLPKTASWMLWNSSSSKAGFSKNLFVVRSFTTCTVKRRKELFHILSFGLEYLFLKVNTFMYFKY